MVGVVDLAEMVGSVALPCSLTYFGVYFTGNFVLGRLILCVAKDCKKKKKKKT